MRIRIEAQDKNARTRSVGETELIIHVEDVNDNKPDIIVNFQMTHHNDDTG